MNFIDLLKITSSPFGSRDFSDMVDLDYAVEFASNDGPRSILPTMAAFESPEITRMAYAIDKFRDLGLAQDISLPQVTIQRVVTHTRPD